MRRVVGGALFNNGKLLVVKRVASEITRPNAWEMPGGKVEDGESDEEALRREFLEETGLKIKVGKKYHTFHYDHEGKPAEENDYFVEAENFNVKIDPNEHSEFRWVARGEAAKLPMSPEMKESVTKAFEVLSGSK